MLQPKITPFFFSHSELPVRFLLTIFCFLLLPTGNATGQEEIRFRQYTKDNGLAGNVVYEVLQDSRGWIWMGTGHGLTIFDGRRFKTYKHDPEAPNSLINNWIYSLYEDRKGKIWIATLGGGLDKYDPETDRFTHYYSDENDLNSIDSDVVYSVAEDKQGTLWVGTMKGLNRLDPETGMFDHFPPDPDDPNSLSSGWVFSMQVDRQGHLWLATSKGLNRFDPTTEQFTCFFHEPGNPRSLSNDALRCVYTDTKGQIWVGTQKDNVLNRFDPDTEDFDHLLLTQDMTVRGMYDIFEDTQGRIWAGAISGLYLLDEKTRKFDHFLPDPHDLPEQTGSANMVVSLTQDHEGTFWFGTWGGGIFSSEGPRSNYREHKHTPSVPNTLSHDLVESVCKTSNGDFWVGTMFGLNHFDPVSQRFTTYLPNPNDMRVRYQSDNHVLKVFEDKNLNLWVGTAEGLFRFDRSTKEFIHYSFSPGHRHRNDIKAIYEDPKGRLWVGSINAGLYQYNADLDSLLLYWDSGDETMLYDQLFLDENNQLWIGGDGLFRMDLETKHIQEFRHDPEDPKSLSNNIVSAMHKDRRGNIWIGTRTGLSLLRRGEPAFFEHFLEKDGLSGSMVQRILEDTKGNLWIDTNNGLSSFDPNTRRFRNYQFRDGNRIYKLVYVDKDTDELWLDTNAGLIIIHPDSLPHNTYEPPVEISRLSIYDSKQPEAKFQEIPAPWSKTSVTLPYRQNTLSAEFSVLSYKDPSQNKAAYKLEGVHNDWIDLGSRREATFSNLRPGKYTLRVKGSNNDGVWNEEGAALQITILPPWWLTFWAKLAYFLLASGILYSLYRYQLNRKLALAETRRLRELDQVKTKLFTNITHEFRTPLTVIQGMADEEIEREGELPKEKNLENARMIKRNSAQLLTLVNQMLDLRKLESGALPVKLVNGDVIQYLRYLTESFDSYARQKEVDLHFLTEEKNLIIDYDPEKLLYIVSNLLSNAIKFTPAGGNVYFTAGANVRAPLVVARDAPENHPNTLSLTIKDTGIGIGAEKLPYIFNRFYQADDSAVRQNEGTGIGLALTKELVKLLGGEIRVNSELGVGTTFTVQLPITRQAPAGIVDTASMENAILGFAGPVRVTTSGLRATTRVAPTGDAAMDDIPLALIIEDNPDVVRYLSSCLEDNYRIATALDGQTGIEMALDTIPDIIISDVMMPKKDGYEVCEILKNDERTSHIPIILLTAKADLDSRIVGLARGADAYLAKPFHREELRVRLEQLIEIRKKLQERYAGLDPQELNDKAYLVEDKFLRKVRQVVEENMSDPDFGLLQLCRAVGLSRSQLFRKLKALTGKSTTLVIRSIRLQRARQLLQTTEMNVSEVAYEVGFNDLTYFSKCFLEEYGERPSAVRTEN